MEFIETLQGRNALLFWFGLINLIAAVIMVILSFAVPQEFGGTNAWYKPIKFALSTFILSWSVGWYSGYLAPSNTLTVVYWVIIVTLAFEVIYIAWQAGRGQASHFNLSTPFYTFMYSLMAIAATVATFAVGYVGIQFFSETTVELPASYLWAIRFGFILFVIFSLQGFVMGSRLAHSIGGPDGSGGIPFLNWSLSYGDLRVAHFIGMHALQVLPIVAWYLFKSMGMTLTVSALYAALAVFVLIQALRGHSILQF